MTLQVMAGFTTSRIGIVDSDNALRSRILTGMRSQFEILEADNFEGAHRLLRESELDVLLLAR